MSRDLDAQDPGLLSQARRLWPLLAALYLPVLGLLIAMQVVATRDDVSLSRYTRDPLAHFDNASPFLGSLSNLGVLLWCAAAAICLFSALLLARARRQGGAGRFLLAFGLLTAWLAVDDLFLMHERLIPGLTGLPQNAIYGGYVAGVALLLIVFGRQVLRSDFLLLLLALGFFAVSVLADMWLDRDFVWHHLIEDGSKLLGIVGWLGYLGRASMLAIISELSGEGGGKSRES